MERKRFTYVTLGVLVWAILVTTVAAYYFVQYNTYRSEYNTLIDQLATNVGDISTTLGGISLKANILLNYGNGTTIWHNNTVLPLGTTAFTAVFSVVDEVNYTDYGGELGILVTSINGVTNNSTHGWFYWYWNSESAEWMLPSYSSAKYILHRGETIAFTYADYMEWPPPSPT
jgi:hypothetical protein